MPRNGNITGQVFDDEVINQIETRQKVLGKRYKDDKTLIYTNNQTAFLRLASSINIDAENQLTDRSINKTLTGMDLAKSCVLFGGVVGIENKLNPKLKFGVYNSSDDPISTIAAYGWGGLGKKGYVPMPAIDNAKVSFYNRGAIQKADVKLKVYSLEQLQIFDLLYFRIGYSMLLEWGHNVWIDNKGELTNRNEFTTEPFKKFFTEGTSQQDIFKAIQTQRKDDSYNYDAMLGKVTNFTWKFNDDGTYDINLKLIGMGDIIESLKVNKAPLASGKTSLTPSEKLNKLESNAGSIEKAADAKSKAAREAVAKKREELEKNQKTLQDLIDRYKQQIIKRFKLIPDTPTPPSLSALNTSGDKRFTPESWGNGRITIPVFGVVIRSSDKYFSNNWTTNSSIQKLQEYRTNNIGSNNKTTPGFPYTVSTDDETNAQTLNAIKDKQKELNDLYSRTRDTKGLIKDKWYTPVYAYLSQIFNIIQQITTTQVDEIEKLEKKAEEVDSQAELQKQAANRIRQQIQKRKDILELSPETSLETKNKSLFNQQLVAWRNEAKLETAKGNLYKLSFTSNDTDVNNSGVSVLALDFYYVRLGYMLEWIQKNLLVYDTTKKDPENKDQANPIFKLDYNSETNFCLRFPGQHSSDPRVCIIPSVYSSESSQWDILKDLNKVAPFFVENNDQVGKLMNIMINIDNTAGILDENLDANGKVNLNKFLTSLFNEVNDVLGNVNKLEPVFNTEENTLTIIDANNVPNADKTFPDEKKKKSIMGVFNVYGIGSETIPNGSFVTNVDFQVQLPPNMAAMATISAQANGNIVGENATGLSKLNKGLLDRLITVKLDADSIEGAKTGENDPTKLFNSTLELVNKSVNELYAKKKFVKATVSSMRSNNRDIALYITGNEEYLKKAPSPFFIPFNLKLDMQGLSGMRNYERFSITEDVLPYSYRAGDQGGVIDFLIKGVSHKIDNNEWTTNIESLSVGALPNDK